MSDTKLITIKEATEKLADLIEKYPSLDIYTNEGLLKNLKSLPSLNDRMLYIFNIMAKKSQDMSNEPDNLRKLINKTTYPD